MVDLSHRLETQVVGGSGMASLNQGSTVPLTLTVIGLPRRSSALPNGRSEEHTSELQSLMRISYAVFCLKKKTKKVRINQRYTVNTEQLQDNCVDSDNATYIHSIHNEYSGNRLDQVL